MVMWQHTSGMPSLRTAWIRELDSNSNSRIYLCMRKCIGWCELNLVNQNAR